MFWVGLSIKMGMSVSRCQQEINSQEFSELIAYNNIKPFLIDRAEYSIAVLSSLMANIHSKNKEFSPEDFLLDQEPKKQDPEAIFNSIKAAYNGGN